MSDAQGQSGDVSGTTQATGSQTGDAAGQGQGQQQVSGDGAGGQKNTPATIIRRGNRATSPDAAPIPSDPQVGVPSYQPNFKFKSMGKEHEFDEFLRGAIKDKESEQKVRDLYEKAFGIDKIKGDRESLVNELSQSKEKIAQTDQALNALSQYIQQGDYDSFFEALKIPKANILQYALAIAQREQWSPEQKAAYEQQRQVAQRAQMMEAQNRQLQESHQQLAMNHRMYELQTVLSRPDISGAVQAYEAGIGSPGAFREYVVSIGQAFAARGTDLSAEQAVQEAMKHLRAVNPQLGAAPQPAVAAHSQVVTPSQKPVIPQIQGRSTSPVKPAVKSLDDLKKRARELEAQGA